MHEYMRYHATMIDSFSGKYRFLSNFYKSPIEFSFPLISVHGEEEMSPIIAVANTVEHGYQASKSNRLDEAYAILTMSTPGKAKRGGRNCSLRSDWESIKLKVMHTLVWEKFSTHEYLKNLLLETGDHELIEGNTWGDKFWGVCDGEGENHLGKILMDTRECLSYAEYANSLAERFGSK